MPTSLKHDNLGVVKELSPMLKHISAEYLLKMKEPDEKLAIAVNFYSLMASVALAAKQQEVSCMLAHLSEKLFCLAC